MADETPSVSRLEMDRGLPIGNSADVFGRRAAHVKVANASSEPIPVTVSSGIVGGTRTNVYNEVLNVASGVPTAVVTYTVASTSAAIERVECGGDNIARYDLQVNGVTISTRQTYFGSGPETTMNFLTDGNEDKYTIGTVIRLIVTQTRPTTSNHHARLQLVVI